MPTYSFFNKETEEFFDKFMSYSEREAYLKNNSNIEPVLTAASIVSGVSSSSQHKVPDGFKEVLSKVAEAHPTSQVAEKHGKRSIKQIKTDQVVKKHTERVTGVKI
jgi:hypothetical protein